MFLCLQFYVKIAILKEIYFIVMKTILKILLSLIFLSASLFPIAFAQENVEMNSLIETKWDTNTHLSEFANKNGEYFIQPWSWNSGDSVRNVFVNIAYGVKNFAILIAVIFLIIWVIKLFFSEASDADVKKWKYNLFYSAAGIFFMQISYSIWRTGVDISNKGGNPINAAMSWEFWHNIIEPILQLLQYLASFAFLAMMIYAFYIIVTGGGDEKKLESGKKIFFFGIVGYLMIKLPYTIVSLLYKWVPQCQKTSTLWSFASANCTSGWNADLSGSVNLVAKIFTYFNGFLTILCVIMAIYAGWLFLISKGDEDKTKKAKRIVFYVAIGLVILVASHAIFRFFLLEGMK